MDMEILMKLLGLSSASILVSVLFYYLKRLTRFGKFNKLTQQVVIGFAFGIVAIMGTQFGVDVGGAIANARDAAPLCAGLLFGGPAGIISGTIGGLYRWFAVSWGAGEYSRLACSVSTFLAGVISDILRKLMFDNKRPNWIFGFSIGAVIEVMHMTILFLTHLDDSNQAFEIVKICTLPMIVCNGISVMLSCVLLSIFSTGIHRHEKRYRKISQLIQTPLLISVIIAYLISSVMIYRIQTGTAKTESRELIEITLDSVRLDITNESNQHILDVTYNIANQLDLDPDADLRTIRDAYEIQEINIVDKNGIIVDSTEKDYIGFDMGSDKDKDESERQSSLFLVLLEDDCNEYVQKAKPIAADKTIYRKYAGVSLKNGGFVQIGYNLETFQNELISHIRILSENRHLGDNGYIIITDDRGRIISNNKEYDGTLLSDAGIDISQFKENTLEAFTYGETECFLYTTTIEGFDVVAVMSKDEIFATRNNMLYIYSYLEVLIFSLLFVIIYIIIKKFIVNNIRSVNSSLGKIIGGNLETTVDVHSSEEFASLSDDINSTVDTLKKYINEAASRIDKELAFAKSIQHSALPSVFPAYPNRKDFDIYATMDTAKEVGGDFYDFYFVDENKFAILIADVSGKGIPAAMFMMTAKTIIKGLAESGMPVDEVFTKANQKLCEGNDADMFVTAWMGIVELDTGHVTFANAGHNPPVIYRKNKGPEYLKSRAGLVLAGMDGLKYKKQEFYLEPGDRIFLYTDGVTEATRSDDVLYGEDRLIEFINRNISLSTGDMLRSIKQDIDTFVGDAEQFDDITMLMFDFNGKKEELKLDEKVFPAKVESLDDAMAYITEKMESADVPMKACMQISVAFEEMFVNVAHYAYADKNGDVKIGVSTANGAVTIQLTDSGIPFNPLEKADPDTTLSAEERQIGGLGILMVKKSMDEVDYEYKNDKNIFTMRKKYE